MGFFRPVLYRSCLSLPQRADNLFLGSSLRHNFFHSYFVLSLNSQRSKCIKIFQIPPPLLWRDKVVIIIQKHGYFILLICSVELYMISIFSFMLSNWTQILELD